MGVSFGLVFFLLVAFFFLANLAGATPGKRRSWSIKTRMPPSPHDWPRRARA